MSDALTDIRRDNERENLRILIKKNEREFLEQPTQEKAQELIGLWKEYCFSRRGYRGSPDQRGAMERIGFYVTWKEGESVDYLIKISKLQNRIPGTVILSKGWGFITNTSDIADEIAREARKFMPINNLTSYKVKISVDSVELITCGVCPDYGECGSGCEGRNEEERKVRITYEKEGNSFIFNKE